MDLVGVFLGGHGSGGPWGVQGAAVVVAEEGRVTCGGRKSESESALPDRNVLRRVIRTAAAWRVRRVRRGGQRAQRVGQAELGRPPLEQGQGEAPVPQLQALGSLLLLRRRLRTRNTRRSCQPHPGLTSEVILSADPGSVRGRRAAGGDRFGRITTVGGEVTPAVSLLNRFLPVCPSVTF